MFQHLLELYTSFFLFIYADYNLQDISYCFRCGLIALVEAMEIFSDDILIDPESVLQQAISLNMTKRGELFSAYDMQLLAKQVFHCGSQVVDTHSCQDIWKILGLHLLEGKVALIP